MTKSMNNTNENLLQFEATTSRYSEEVDEVVVDGLVRAAVYETSNLIRFCRFERQGGFR